MTNQSVVVFAAETSALTFTDKKGNLHAITAEGALFKGGEAIKALKDLALESALHKAINGRYRAASDIICTAFPSIGKAADKLIGTPWANKSSMATLLNAVGRASPGAKGWTDKQSKARMLVAAMANLPAFKVEPTEVIENAPETPADAPQAPADAPAQQ
jgi:hypothetical protein